MSETNLISKNLMNELQSLTNQLKQSKETNKEEDHVLKVDQQQDGHINFGIYAGDNLLYESSGHYKMDYSNTRYEVSCINDHCKTTVEYGLIEDTAHGSKIRVEEKHDDHSDRFNINLAFYDESGNALEKYGTELSFQYNQDVEPQGHFIIYDLFAIEC